MAAVTAIEGRETGDRGVRPVVQARVGHVIVVEVHARDAVANRVLHRDVVAEEVERLDAVIEEVSDEHLLAADGDPYGIQQAARRRRQLRVDTRSQREFGPLAQTHLREVDRVVDVVVGRVRISALADGAKQQELEVGSIDRRLRRRAVGRHRAVNQITVLIYFTGGDRRAAGDVVEVLAVHPDDLAVGASVQAPRQQLFPELPLENWKVRCGLREQADDAERQEADSNERRSDLAWRR